MLDSQKHRSFVLVVVFERYKTMGRLGDRGDWRNDVERKD